VNSRPNGGKLTKNAQIKSPASCDNSPSIRRHPRTRLRIERLVALVAFHFTACDRSRACRLWTSDPHADGAPAQDGWRAAVNWCLMEGANHGTFRAGSLGKPTPG
jgi:hypothetical protein